MASKRTTIYLNEPLALALQGLADRGQSARLGDIADRFAEIVRRARIAQRFSEAELMALRDCCNGTWFQPAKLIDGAVLANFSDSGPDGLYEKWGIDAQAVIDKLQGLSFADQVALVEDIEGFWRSVAADPVEPDDL